MRLKQQSRVLKRKALAALISAIEAFNSPHDTGRATKVLLHPQHAFEMLLKAAIVQTGERIVLDRESGGSIGFEKCINLASASASIQLGESDAGALRTIYALRNCEQHWFNQVSEQLLYLHARAGVTLFDELLLRVFTEHLADYLPTRVLPISIDPPQDLDVILDEEHSQIATLLQPGRRASHEAHARIRTLLAMEAHVAQDVRVSDKDVQRVVRGIRAGEPRSHVFPRLGEVATATDGSGITIKVHFTKAQGAPVRYVDDESEPAAAVREVDLYRKFRRSPTELAKSLGLSGPRAVALRRHLGIDADDRCVHVFVFGSQRHRRYSDKALAKMRDALTTVDMGVIWQAHNASRLAGKCSIPGCQVA